LLFIFNIYLTKKFNISRQTYTQIETGKTDLTILRAKKLAKIFSLNLEDFIVERDEIKTKISLQKEKKIRNSYLCATEKFKKSN